MSNSMVSMPSSSPSDAAFSEEASASPSLTTSSDSSVANSSSSAWELVHQVGMDKMVIMLVAAVTEALEYLVMISKLVGEK